MRRGKGYTVRLHGRRRRNKIALTSGCRRYLALLLWRRGFCHLCEDRCQSPGLHVSSAPVSQTPKSSSQMTCGSSVSPLTASGLSSSLRADHGDRLAHRTRLLERAISVAFASTRRGIDPLRCWPDAGYLARMVRASLAYKAPRAATQKLRVTSCGWKTTSAHNSRRQRCWSGRGPPGRRVKGESRGQGRTTGGGRCQGAHTLPAITARYLRGGPTPNRVKQVLMSRHTFNAWRRGAYSPLEQLCPKNPDRF